MLHSAQHGIERSRMRWVLAVAVMMPWTLASALAPAARGRTILGQGAQEDLRQLEHQGLDSMMNGDLEAAIDSFRQIQKRDPLSPLGYLLEGDATWWLIYCSTADLIDPEVFDVVRSQTSPYDARFEELVNLSLEKSAERIRNHQDEAENHLYEGLAYALRARLVGLRGHDLPTARAGKKMRSNLLKALELDPRLSDAYLGIGLYNYFVDTLPVIVKMLRFFIFLPGGSREVGLQQLQTVAEKGELARGEAKFLLAKDYSRTSELQYARSLELFQGLEREYPRNSLWTLLQGTLYCRLGQNVACDQFYRQAFAETAGKPGVSAMGIHAAARTALQKLHPNEQFGQ